MIRKRRKRKSDFKIIQADQAGCVLQFTPDTSAYESEEIETIYKNVRPVLKEKEEVPENQLNERESILFQLYSSNVDNNNLVFFTDQEAADKIYIPLRSLQRIKKRLKELGLIKVEFNKERKQMAVRVLQSAKK